jgi:hypothetical protein
MLDVNKQLKHLGQAHLPPKFDPKKGVAKMCHGRFPRKMSQIAHPVSSAKGSAMTSDGVISANFLVMFDLCGHWFFDFYLSISPGQSGTWGAGFVFKFPKSGVGHGYTATGSYSAHTDPLSGTDTGGCIAQSISGYDPWIQDNYDQLVADSVQEGVSNNTDVSPYTLQGTGLTGPQNLGGSQASPVSQSGTAVNNTPPCWFVSSAVWGVPLWRWEGGAAGPPVGFLLGPGYGHWAAWAP